MSRLLIIILLFVLAPVQAQTCPVSIPQNFTRAERACTELERGEACYGSGKVEVEFLPGFENQTFEAPGDRVEVAGLTEIRTGETDVASTTWGIATILVQANLIEEQPSRNSRLLMFGETRVENAVPPLPEVTLTSTGTLNIRKLPSQESDIIRELNLREWVVANGRTEDNRWLRVLVPRKNTLGWMASDIGTITGDINSLEIVTPDTPFFRPFQIITLETGANDSPCGDAPNSGLIIQTPNDFNNVTLIVNDVRLRMTATAFIQTTSDGMIINILNGRATVMMGEQQQEIPAGARTMVSSGSINPAEPYMMDDLINLPIKHLDYTFEVIEPLTPDEILAALLSPTPEVQPISTPVIHSRCVRSTTQEVNLRGGPADHYEVVGQLPAGANIIAVYEQTDPDGRLWWQTRYGGWLLTEYVYSTGDCDEVPRTTALIRPPQYNNLNLERCDSDNGPIRDGQEVEITFLDGSWATYDEARQAVRVAPPSIKVGNQRLSVYPSNPFLVSEERWYVRFTAYWTAESGSYEITGSRAYYYAACDVTVPVGD